MQVFTGTNQYDSRKITMIPTEQKQAEDKTIKDMNKFKRETCKNASFDYEQDKVDYTTREFTFKITNKGCNNLRRNGSAWCQDCSDKFKQDNK